MDIKAMVLEKAKSAKKAARKLAGTSTAVKNEALIAMADGLIKARDELKKEMKRTLPTPKKRDFHPRSLTGYCLMTKGLTAWLAG